MSLLDRLANWLDRRELARLRKIIVDMKEADERRKPRIDYLESRDRLCSQMANTINAQAFEIAKLKGEYSKPTGG